MNKLNPHKPNAYDPAQNIAAAQGMNMPVHGMENMPMPQRGGQHSDQRAMMRRQMMAQMLASQPFKNPQMVPMQQQMYS